MSASRQPCGPAPQLTPIASTSRVTSAAAAVRRRRAVRQGDLLAEGQERHDRPVGRGQARLLDRDREMVERRECLEHEQVHAALEQAVDGLAERGPDRCVAEVGEVVGGSAQRPDGPGDEDVPAGHVPGLAGDLGAAPRQPAGLVGETVGGEADPVGAERRGLDQVGAGREVLAVDGADQLGPRQDQLVQRGTLRDPAREEQRAHRPVGQQRTLGEAFAEPGARIHARTIADAP